MQLIIEQNQQIHKGRAIITELLSQVPLNTRPRFTQAISEFLADTDYTMPDKTHMDDIEPMEANHELEKNSFI